MYSITQTFYVLNLPAFYKRNDIREPNIVLCLAVEFLSHGPSEKKISSRISYQTTFLLDKPLTACVRPFKPGHAGLIPGFLSLSDDTIN